MTHDDESNLEQTDHEPVDDDHGDDHGHAEEHLGPIDWGAWGAALIGAVAALLVVAVFWVVVF